MSFTVRFLYNGKFYQIRNKPLYRKSEEYVKEDVDPDLLSKMELEGMLLDDVGISSVSELWYLIPGKSLEYGLRQVCGDSDILDMVSSVSRSWDRTCHVYVVQKGEKSPLELSCAQPIRQVPPVNLAVPTDADVEKQGDEEADGNDAAAHLDLSSDECAENFDGPAVGVNSGSINEEDVDERVGVQSVVGSESDDTDESDFCFVQSDKEDDDIWDEYVDESVKDDAAALGDGVEDQAFSDEEAASSAEIEDESDGFMSLSDSDGGRKNKDVDFNPLVDFKKPVSLKVGMRFGSNEIFRRALREFAVQQGGDFYYLHNDKNKISAYCRNKCECKLNKYSRIQCVCKKTLCGWRACARRISDDGTFQLKTINSNHECGWTERNTKVTSKWLAEKYLEHYREDPQWRLKGFISSVRRDHTVKITYAQAWRARVRALLMTQGDACKQYGKVWDYAATLKKWSDGTSAFVKVCIENPEKPLFQRLYICLEACKKGFLLGCRPILGLDGCHLKGAYSGQLLCAVGKDGNDNLFPVAYAVVEIENKETWCWFLESLMQDLGQVRITFISDRQKVTYSILYYIFYVRHLSASQHLFHLRISIVTFL